MNNEGEDTANPTGRGRSWVNRLRRIKTFPPRPVRLTKNHTIMGEIEDPAARSASSADLIELIKEFIDPRITYQLDGGEFTLELRALSAHAETLQPVSSGFYRAPHSQRLVLFLRPRNDDEIMIRVAFPPGPGIDFEIALIDGQGLSTRWEGLNGPFICTVGELREKFIWLLNTYDYQEPRSIEFYELLKLLTVLRPRSIIGHRLVYVNLSFYRLSFLWSCTCDDFIYTLTKQILHREEDSSVDIEVAWNTLSAVKQNQLYNTLEQAVARKLT